MAQRMKSKMTAPKVLAEPKRSDTFTEMTVKDMTITFRKDTARYVLKRGEEFLLSDANLDHILRHLKHR